MLGDMLDMQQRLRSLLPRGWFSDAAPNLSSILLSIGAPWARLYQLLQYAIRPARIATASDHWLDLIAADFFGGELCRVADEPDSVFRARIKYLLFRSAATRGAISSAVEHLTGFAPWIFEPSNTADTGAYAGGGSAACSGMAYGSVGGWGSLALPFQFLMVVQRPILTGLALLPGYSCGQAGYNTGSTAYADLGLLPGMISDAEILSSLRGLLPVNATAWIRTI